jgi:ubiquitin-protein ligase E3 C
VLLLRAQRLASLSLEALSRHAGALATDLSAPLASASAHASAAATLCDCVVTLTRRDAWAPTTRRDDAMALDDGGGAAAPAAAADEGAVASEGPADDVLRSLLRRGAFRTLRALVLAAAPAPPAAPPSGSGSSSVLETLVLHLWTRADAADAAAASAALPAAERAAAQLLSLPLLWRRLPGLAAAAAPALWTHALTTLTVAPPASDGGDVLSSLPPPASCDADVAGAYPSAAWLLGNLLEAAPAALAAARRDGGGAAHAAAALRFAAVTEALLAALPRAALGPPDSEEEAEAAAEAAAAAAATQQQEALLPPPPAALAAQLSLVTDGALLRDLIHAVLPAPPSEEDAAGAVVPMLSAEAASGAVRLCSLLHVALTRLRGAERARLLASLAFSAGLVARLWGCVRACADAGAWGAPQNTPASTSSSAPPGWLLPLAVLSRVYTFTLYTADDEEFYERGSPLPRAQNARLVTLLRDALWQLLWTDASSAPAAAASTRAATTGALARLFAQLHARNGRRRFAPADAFFRVELSRRDALAERVLADAAAADPDAEDMETESAALSGGAAAAAAAASASRAAHLLSAAPALAPFHLRAALFQELCAADRDAALGAHSHNMFGGWGGFGGGGAHFANPLTIRRDRLLEDGLSGLGALPPGALRGPIRIRFVDAHGAPEAGIDGGGLFKDFLDDLVRSAFDPRHGLWRTTPSHALYPSPASGAAANAAGGTHLEVFRFQGAVLGKALFEGMLAELPFASFFLAKLRGDAMELNDLASLDEPLYRSLLFLKRFTGDHAALCLFFTTTRDGGGEEIELVPGGRDVPVTARNKLQYIHLVANYKLNVQIKPQCDAFLSGFHALIKPRWVRMFSADELQALIGGSAAGVSVPDLARWTVYSGGFHEGHPTVRLLWECVAELPPPQQAAFLKFVTACSRAPLLGFRTLEPRFCVHRAGVAGTDAPDESADLERLPTAATCMNLLKLPPYTRKEDMAAKLLYAISAHAGFDLS